MEDKLCNSLDELIKTLKELDEEIKKAKDQFGKSIFCFKDKPEVKSIPDNRCPVGFNKCFNCGTQYKENVSGCSVCGHSFCE